MYAVAACRILGERTALDRSASGAQSPPLVGGVRRRAGRVLRLSSALVALLLVACVGSTSSAPSMTGPQTVRSEAGSDRSCPEDAIPPGDYEHIVTKADVPPDFELTIGYWVATVTGVTDPNCYFPVFFTQYDHEGGKVLFSEEHPYTVEGQWLVFHGMNEPNAHYRLVIDGDTIWFAGGHEDGSTRRVVLQASPLTRIS
jgi:hypothetical protein